MRIIYQYNVTGIVIETNGCTIGEEKTAGVADSVHSAVCISS